MNRPFGSYTIAYVQQSTYYDAYKQGYVKYIEGDLVGVKGVLDKLWERCYVCAVCMFRFESAWPACLQRFIVV
jgi:hypothetical protein